MHGQEQQQSELEKLTQEEYNFMLVGAFELLSAKRDEIEAYKGYVEGLRGFWTARAMLRSALGGVLPVVMAKEAEPEPPTEIDARRSGHEGHSVPTPSQAKPEDHQHHHQHGGEEHGK